MKYLLTLLFLFLTSFTNSNTRINYMDPVEGANYVSTENSITLGFDNQIILNKTEIKSCITVKGSKSGLHEGTVIYCNNDKEIIFKPIIPFNENEKITVKISGKLLKTLYPLKKEYSYSFSTITRRVQWDPLKSMEEDFDPNQGGLPDIPRLTVTVDNNPSEGSIFLSSYTVPSYLIITNKDGNPYWSSQISSITFDFKKQPNGDLTYYSSGDKKHYEINQNYNLVNSYYCGNGYSADGHDLRVLNNGHALLMAYDPEVVDMSHIVPGGKTNAEVIGLIIQEIDENKNVVFQWRSWDHIPITDALHELLTAANIDYVHGNAIEIDNDNNLIISARHLDAIIKINRTTGDIMWHFGGLENDFTITNDSLWFTYQHAVRRIANGNITIFDNGNFHNPPFTRIVEYSLNETNRTAALVWQYRHNPDIFSSFMGYVERLSSGNTLIGWGGANPTVTEITSDGTVVFEMAFPPHTYSYRAYKYNWSGNPVSVNNGQGSIPLSYKLSQNFPNPFNPRTEITYDIPKASQVELSVFDETGRELKKLVSGYKQPGSYKTAFDGSNYSSGLYFYRLEAGDFSQTRKMILIK